MSHDELKCRCEEGREKRDASEPTGPAEELHECPNCHGSVWNEIENGYQCDGCGYLDI